MTEAEWLACTDPKPMLVFLECKASDRKLRLFTVACCECSRQLLQNRDHLHALELSTRFAEGQATEEELTNAYRRAHDFACELYPRAQSEREIRRWAEATAVANATAIAAPPISSMAYCAADAIWMIERAAHRNPDKRIAELLRDIFGNPFRIVAVDPSWLVWNDGTIVKLAQAIYDNRAFDRLPILADALEEAGCSNADILAHCRQSGEHVRGCWVVDLILGKE